MGKPLQDLELEHDLITEIKEGSGKGNGLMKYKLNRVDKKSKTVPLRALIVYLALF